MKQEGGRRKNVWDWARKHEGRHMEIWREMRSKTCRRERGNVGSLMATPLCMLAMVAVMLSYMDNVQIIQQKMDVSQLARKYILRMETVGYLTYEDKNLLTGELLAVGVTEVSYEGTTESNVGYGEGICLQIAGKLRGEYDFVEKRVSTAKN